MAYAPGQQLMQPTTNSLEKFFGDKKAILVKQEPRGCLQECMGCEAKSEYKISNMDFSYLGDRGHVSEQGLTQPDEMYALEQSSFCMRLCWRDGRAMSINVSTGGEPGGIPIIDYSKPCGCPLTMLLPLGEDGGIEFPCCCCLPELTTTVNGEELKSKYICDAYCCVSKFAYMENGAEVYRLKPDTCCGGCLPACRCQGRRPAIPYFFYDGNGNRITDGETEDSKQPQIRKVWGGLKRECCTTADTFAVFFPEEADVKRKAGLLGLTFLLDFVVFERQTQNAA
jgi:hypothetical protein